MSASIKKVYWAIIGVALALLAAGTAWDVQISTYLYSPESGFGRFFAVAAMVPIWLLIPMATGLMFGFLITQFPALRNRWRAICLLLVLFGIYATIVRMDEMVGSRHLHGLPYGVLVWMVVLSFMGTTALGAHAAKRYPLQVFLAAFIGIAAIAGSRLLLDNGKSLWGRMRFWVMDNPAAQFTPWYAPQFPSAERMAEMGDYIKSFPSGHSMGGISLLWLSLLPPFIGSCSKSLTRWMTGISMFALCFWGCTIVSRVILGEHFLSDVAVSGIVFLLFFVFFTFIANKYHPCFAQSEQSQKHPYKRDSLANAAKTM